MYKKLILLSFLIYKTILSSMPSVYNMCVSKSLCKSPFEEEIRGLPPHQIIDHDKKNTDRKLHDGACNQSIFNAAKLLGRSMEPYDIELKDSKITEGESGGLGYYLYLFLKNNQNKQDGIGKIDNNRVFLCSGALDGNRIRGIGALTEKFLGACSLISENFSNCSILVPEENSFEMRVIIESLNCDEKIKEAIKARVNYISCVDDVNFFLKNKSESICIGDGICKIDNDKKKFYENYFSNIMKVMLSPMNKNFAINMTLPYTLFDSLECFLISFVKITQVYSDQAEELNIKNKVVTYLTTLLKKCLIEGNRLFLDLIEYHLFKVFKKNFIPLQIKLAILNNITFSAKNTKYNKNLFYFLLKLKDIIDSDVRAGNGDLREAISKIIVQIAEGNNDENRYLKIYEEIKKISKDKQDTKGDDYFLLSIKKLKDSILMNFFSDKADLIAELKKKFPRYFEFYDFLEKEFNIKEDIRDCGDFNKIQDSITIENKYTEIIEFLKKNNKLFQKLQENFLNERGHFDLIYPKELNQNDTFVLLFFLFDSVNQEELFKIYEPEYKRALKAFFYDFFIHNKHNSDLLLIAYIYFKDRYSSILDDEMLQKKDDEMLQKKKIFRCVLGDIISSLVIADSNYRLLIFNDLLCCDEELLSRVSKASLDQAISPDFLNNLKDRYCQNHDYVGLKNTMELIVQSNNVSEYIAENNFNKTKSDEKEKQNLELFSYLCILEKLLKIEQENNNMSLGFDAPYCKFEEKIYSSNFKDNKLSIITKIFDWLDIIKFLDLSKDNQDLIKKIAIRDLFFALQFIKTKSTENSFLTKYDKLIIKENIEAYQTQKALLEKKKIQIHYYCIKDDELSQLIEYFKL